MHTETKVGLFTLSGIAVFATGILLLGDISFNRSYDVKTLFDNADGLPVNGSVKVAGVEVGKIKKIELANQRAMVTLKMNHGIDVHKGSRVRVASTGMIGSKYMEMTLGDPAAPLLGRDEVIKGDASFNFDDMMNKLGEFFEEDKNGSVSDNLKVAIANLRHVSDGLNEALGGQRTALVETIKNLRDLSADAKEVARNWSEITAAHREDIEVALAKVRSVSERLDDVLAKVQSGKGLLGKLVGDEDMGKDLKQTLSSVREAAKDAQSVMGRVARTEVDWDFRERYDFKDKRSRFDAGMNFIPRPGEDKFYYLGGNNLGARTDRLDAGNDIERRNTVTAVMGNSWGPFTGYIGLIRSNAGGGGRMRFLPKSNPWSDRVELEGEAYNFGRNEVIQGIKMKGAIYNVGARVKVLKQPTVWAGVDLEDVAQRRKTNAYLNIRFRDEDIAYLLGLAGLAKP